MIDHSVFSFVCIKVFFKKPYYESKLKYKMFSYCVIKFQHYIWCPSPNTMLCQLSLHEKQCNRIQNNILRILFYQNMCHWMVHLKRFSGGAYLSIKHCLVIHIHQWELLKAVYCPARCVNDWPRWSETYPNIQTHSFFSWRRY